MQARICNEMCRRLLEPLIPARSRRAEVRVPFPLPPAPSAEAAEEFAELRMLLLTEGGLEFLLDVIRAATDAGRPDAAAALQTAEAALAAFQVILLMVR